MSEPAPLGRGDRGHQGRRWLRLLAVLFTAATGVSLMLVAVDLLIGRPAAGDLFIMFLNALTAAVLWPLVNRHSRA